MGICGVDDRLEEGFTLIEVIVAFFVVAIATIPLVTLYLTASNVSRTNGVRVEATALAADALDLYSAIPAKALGYYQDEFSTQDPNYPPTSPTNNSSLSEFDSLFGTQPNNSPVQIPGQGLPVYVGSSSPGGTPGSDLVQPLHVIRAVNIDFYVYVFVTWNSSISPNLSGSGNAAAPCAYKLIKVSVYWDSWKQVVSDTSNDYTFGLGQNPATTTTAAGGPSPQCNTVGNPSSAAPSAPTKVAVSLPNPETNPVSANVSWVQNNNSPVGYFIVEYSTDPSLQQSIETTSIEAPVPGNTALQSNPDPSPGATDYQLSIAPLESGSTYYVEVWAYSQDGSSATGSNLATTSYLNGAGSGLGVGINIPPVVSVTPLKCVIDSLNVVSYPSNLSTTVSGLNPIVSGKLYLNPDGSSPENLMVVAQTENCPSIPTNFSFSYGYQNQGTSFSALGNYPFTSYHPGNAAGSSGEYDFTLSSTFFNTSSSSVQLPAANYQFVFDSGSGSGATPYGTVPVKTLFLVCPYVPVNERTQVTNQC